MKRYIIFIGILIIFFSVYLQCENRTLSFSPLTQAFLDESETDKDTPPGIEGLNSTVDSSSNGYTENVSIVSHRIFIPDKEEFAREVIQMITDNSLKGILFSYDIKGYPNGLHITVYLNEASFRSGNSDFEIYYIQDGSYGFMYNIKDDPERFVIEIVEG